MVLYQVVQGSTLMLGYCDNRILCQIAHCDLFTIYPLWSVRVVWFFFLGAVLYFPLVKCPKKSGTVPYWLSLTEHTGWTYYTVRILWQIAYCDTSVMSFPNSVTISDYHCTSLRRAASCWRSPFRWPPSARRSTRPGCRSSRAWLLLPLPDWKGFPRWKGWSPTTQWWSRVPPPTATSRTFFCSLSQFRNNFSIFNLNFSSCILVDYRVPTIQELRVEKSIL